jgi:hypothetical protein
MATPKLILTGTGSVSQPGRISRDKDGTISESTISRIFSALETLTAKFNNGISLGDGIHLSRAGNLDAQTIEFISPDVANTEIAIDHSLGRVPIGFIPILQNANGRLYTSNFGGWSKNTIYLKDIRASVLWSIFVF